MALSPERARHHIESWSTRLAGDARRCLWPRYLFHAAHVTTAAAILRGGQLVSRQALGTIEHDVANQGALANNPAAHDLVRLYFRPRNAFHLKTEGIKLRGDRYRQAHEMSIPVLFAFRSEAILCRPEVGFSDGMLSKRRRLLRRDSDFDRLRFDLIYAAGPPPDGTLQKEAQDAQMAEVVLPGQLPLADHLQAIFCRTHLERRTLLHLLGGEARHFQQRVRVEPTFCALFFHRGLYLQSLEHRLDWLTLKVHLPYPKPDTASFRVRVEQLVEGKEVDHWESRLDLEQASARLSSFSKRPGATWRVWLEGELAFEAPLLTDVSVVV